MFEEAITIVAIIGGSAAAAWYAKSKFQPEIERNLEKSERQTHRRSNSQKAQGSSVICGNIE